MILFNSVLNLCIFACQVEGIQQEDHSQTSEIERAHSNYLIDEPPPRYEAPPNYEEAIRMYKELMKTKDDCLKVNVSDVGSNGKLFVCLSTLCNNIDGSIFIFTQFQKTVV